MAPQLSHMDLRACALLLLACSPGAAAATSELAWTLTCTDGSSFGPHATAYAGSRSVSGGATCTLTIANASDASSVTVISHTACPAGTYQDEVGSTGCEACPRGYYCVGSSGTPCPAGTYANATGLSSLDQCTPVPPGFYAATGSALPEPCPGSAFFCPGAAADEVHDPPGSKPIILPVGSIATIETVMVEGALVTVVSRQTCQPGFWCSAGYSTPCTKGTYNPHPEADSQTACTPCPGSLAGRSTTAGENSTSIADCLCNPDYYDALGASSGGIDCQPCGVGTDCSLAGATLSALPLKPGYYRASLTSIDVRRCPDAGAICRDATEACAAAQLSGCRGGGEPSAVCHDGLEGAFCQLCVNASAGDTFYVKGKDGTPAHCEPCTGTAGPMVGLISGAIAAVLVLALLARAALHHISAGRKDYARRIIKEFRLGVKLKIVIGFYQIATKLGRVYDMSLPAELVRVLDAFEVAVSFGLDSLAAPLTCIGIGGFGTKLRFWMALPAVLAAIAFAISCAHSLIRSPARWTKALLPSLLKGAIVDALPVVLRLLFLCYPVVTTVAFEAFRCHDFGDDGEWLITDVAVECGGEEHATIKATAWLAIALYPIGQIVLNALLLLTARRAIVSQHKTALSRGLSFLHKDYEPPYFWWELMEMGRRFVLVGLFVILKPGSLLQLILAFLIALIFLIIQLQVGPYIDLFDDFLATASSFSIAVLLFFCVVLKVGTLTELPDVRDRLSREMVDAFHVPSLAITIIMAASVLASLAVALVLVAQQARRERHRQIQEARAAKGRRLRYVADDKEVHAPRIGEGKFHLFLSHVWGTGQDQMRVVKQRLLEMMPWSKVFLDVDDLAEGKGAEYVDASSLTLIFCSDGYFSSPNCMRELLRAVLTGKPIVAMLETEAKHGGLNAEQVRTRLLAADAKYEGWGLAAEMRSWEKKGEVAKPAPEGMPLSEHLHSACFSRSPIEWNRIGAFQDVTMRMLAYHMLHSAAAASSSEAGAASGSKDSIVASPSKQPSSSRMARWSMPSPSSAWSSRASKRSVPHGAEIYYLQGEVSQRKPSVPPPRSGRKYHLYISPHNAGAAELVSEVAAGKLQLQASSSLEQLAECERMLVYLTGQTWTSGKESAAFAEEVEAAMRAGVRLLLAHEMPGVGQEGRHATEFGNFFACAEGTTPSRLHKLGIYDTIATPLKGGEWRKASMVMLAGGIGEPPKPDSLADALPDLSVSLAGPSRKRDRRRSSHSCRAVRISREVPDALAELSVEASGLASPSQLFRKRERRLSASARAKRPSREEMGES